MKKRLFVSYSRKDSDLVDEFVKSSALFNFDVWIDKRDQEYGKKWRDSLTQAIKNSDGAILFVTPNSLSSKAVKELEIPTFLHQKDLRGEDFKLYIVILDYVPEVSLNEFQSVNGEYIFKERHIKNVGANRLDSEQKLPSEMMSGARQKYWYKLCEEISEDLSYFQEYKNINKFNSLLNKFNLKRIVKLSALSSIVSVVLYLGYFGINSINNRVNSTLKDFNQAIEEISINDASNISVLPEENVLTPTIIINNDSQTENSQNSSDTPTASSSTTTSSTTTTVQSTTTTLQNSNVRLGEKFTLNLIGQDEKWLDELFLNWVDKARVFSITQYEEGVVISFTPLYDLNGYKLYLNGQNVGSINFFGSWYTRYNNVVLKNLTDNKNYTLEIYLVDRYYREFGPILFDFQYVWNSDDAFPHNNLTYTDFEGVLLGDLPNNPGGDGNEKPLLKTDLNNLDIVTVDLGATREPRYRVTISNLVYERFTHFLVVLDNQIIYLSNVLDFYVTEDMFDKYLKIIPFNNILLYSNSFDLLITKTMFEG